MHNFSGPSWLKLKKAKKHISDVHSMLLEFASSDFYDLFVDKDSERGTNHLRVEYKQPSFPADEAAVVIGGALHNLRSALDLMYYGGIVRSGMVPTKWTRFPVRDRRDQLEPHLKKALEDKRINLLIHNFILDRVKPYQAGNYPLWALDDLNIRDKHQLLVPVLKLMGFTGVLLEDQERGVTVQPNFIADEPFRLSLREAGGLDLAVKAKGHATMSIFFNLGVPYEGEAILPTLGGIAEEVTRTIEAFELLLS